MVKEEKGNGGSSVNGVPLRQVEQNCYDQEGDELAKAREHHQSSTANFLNN